MSLHEFVTIATFYLRLLSEGVCTHTLADGFLSKISDSLSEFNELQLNLFKSSLERSFMVERSRYGDDE